MTSLITRFWNDESGQGLTEYALIIAIVAVALIAVLIIFRNNIGRIFDRASNELNNAPGNPYSSQAST